MKELNPLIRNAVYSALYSMQYYKDSFKAKEFIVKGRLKPAT
jgi:hypothetical protein